MNNTEILKNITAFAVGAAIGAGVYYYLNREEDAQTSSETPSE
nr:MAG TPA: YtxH-like protein [Caudoviricetes sp.]